MAETIQDIQKTGFKGVRGARWLLGDKRRTGKLTSSVVIFLEERVPFLSEDCCMKIRGRKLPVSVYDYDRGRKQIHAAGGFSSW